MLPRAGIATIEVEGSEPHEFPASDLSIDNGALIVSDDYGMKVASYPFVDATQVSPGAWHFVGPTDDFTVIIKGGADATQQ